MRPMRRRASRSARAGRSTSSRSTPPRTAASTTIRDLRERINYAPSDLRRKVYILDEAHQITKDAWNALLKSLEEPPDFVTFMFASTHPQDFPPGDRLAPPAVRRPTPDGRPRSRASSAGSSPPSRSRPSPRRVHLVARLAAGGMRDAESMLDQLLAAAGDTITEAGVRDLLGLADAEAVDRLVTALADGDAAAGIAILDELEDRGRDLGIVLDQVGRARPDATRRASFDGSGDPAATARLTRARPEPRVDRPGATRRRWPPAPGRARAVRRDPPRPRRRRCDRAVPAVAADGVQRRRPHRAEPPRAAPGRRPRRAAPDAAAAAAASRRPADGRPAAAAAAATPVGDADARRRPSRRRARDSATQPAPSRATRGAATRQPRPAPTPTSTAS